MQIDFKRFWENGLRPDLPEYIRNKVKASNMVGLALMFIAIAYWIVSSIFNPELNFIPIIGVVVVFLAGLLNYVGFTTLSRFLLAVVPTFIAILYQAYLVKPGEEPLAGLMLLSLSFSVIPFVLFDLREGKHVYVPIALCLAFQSGKKSVWPKARPCR